MKTQSKDVLIEKFDHTLGTYYFYEEYIIAEIHEGVTVTLSKLHDLMPTIQKYYGNKKPFTYISNRIHSHSIIPTDYLDCPLTYMDNFRGYGVVIYNEMNEISTEIEKYFAKKPFYNFRNLEDAILWSKKEVSNK